MKTIIHEKRHGMMSKVEANSIKAKTRFLNHANLKDWIRLVVAIILGIVIVIIGLVQFLNHSNNVNYIALIAAGIFILSATKPKTDDILKLIGK